MAIKTKQVLKDDVDRDVHANGNREITGTQMNIILNDIIDSMFGLLNNNNLVGMRDHDPTVAYDATMGVFDQSAVFRSLIAQQGTFDSATWQRITGTQVLSLTEFNALRSSESLNPNIIYQIKDLYHYRIIARDNKNVQAFGFMTMYIPKGIVALYSQSNMGTYSVDDKVKWNNMVWQLSTAPDVNIPGIDPQWVAVEYNFDDYDEISLMASYDFVANKWRYMADDRGNVIIMTDENTYSDKVWQLFAWNNVKVFNNTIIDSIIANLCNNELIAVFSCEVNSSLVDPVMTGVEGALINCKIAPSCNISIVFDDPSAVSIVAHLGVYANQLHVSKNSHIEIGDSLFNSGYLSPLAGMGYRHSLQDSNVTQTILIPTITTDLDCTGNEGGITMINNASASTISIKNILNQHITRIRLKITSLSNKVTIEHATGNIKCKGGVNKTLDTVDDWIDLMYNNGTWYEVDSGLY